MGAHCIKLGYLFAFAAIVLGKSVEADSAQESHSTCTYTFTVPRITGEVCLPGGNEEGPSDASITSLQTLLSNQHTELTQKLDAIIEKLDSLEDVDMQGVDGNVNQDGNENNRSNLVGTNYVRWGRTSCPDSAQLIYDGYAGKAHYQHGGGVNYLCLPKVLEFPDNVTPDYQSQSYVYGVEYQRHGSPVLDEALNDNDVPCAVCEARGRTQTLMIPAKKSCPDGWTKEYHGLLMADHHQHKGSEFICVADDMESLLGGSANQNGGLLYVVEAVCGALKCPPYAAGYELACVVCTK